MSRTGRRRTSTLSGACGANIDSCTDLFEVVAEFRLSVPPAIAAVFRALATVEGTLALLSPGFNIMVESRAFANRLVGERLQPESLRRAVAEELTSVLSSCAGGRVGSTW